MKPADVLAKLKTDIDAANEATTAVIKAPKTNPKKEEVLGAPYIRKGENSLGSRGFQFQRLFGAICETPGFDMDNAKIELDIATRMHRNYLIEQKGFVPYQGARSFLAPFATDLMGGGTEIDEQFRQEIKSLCYHGVGRVDPDEMAWIARKVYNPETKANQSWLDETLGGGLVPPPEFGELIQLLRNKDALINLGARVEPLPPSGRRKFPRQTSPTTAYAVGENTATTASTFGTGTLELGGKKLGILVTLPNELIRFASPASEALLRADITKSLALAMDKYALEGVGSTTQPLGLVNQSNLATTTPFVVAATNGNTISPQDVFAMVAAVEANNGQMQGYLMRPEMFYQFLQARSNSFDATHYGQFVFNQMRSLSDGYAKVIGGFPCVTTPQVSITRVKGSGTTLTYVAAGQWDDFILAMFGAIEFAQAFQGDTAFAADQTVVRGILTYDSAPRHPGVFTVMDFLLQAIGG